MIEKFKLYESRKIMDFGYLVIDSLSKYLERKIIDVEIDGYGSYIIYKKDGDELFRLFIFMYNDDTTSYFTFVMKNKLYEYHRDVVRDLNDILGNQNQILRREFETVILFLDKDNYEKIQKIKKANKFNL